MAGLTTPPIKEPISNKFGIVGIIWFAFFQSIYRLFSQPIYGSKVVTFTITGVTGSYTTSYKWITDRDFVHFYIRITPTTSITLTSANILPVMNLPNFSDAPLNPSIVDIALVSGSLLVDSRQGLITSTGIVLPNLTTTYSVLISGTYIKTF